MAKRDPKIRYNDEYHKVLRERLREYRAKLKDRASSENIGVIELFNVERKK